MLICYFPLVKGSLSLILYGLKTPCKRKQEIYKSRYRNHYALHGVQGFFFQVISHPYQIPKLLCQRKYRKPLSYYPHTDAHACEHMHRGAGEHRDKMNK